MNEPVLEQTVTSASDFWFSEIFSWSKQQASTVSEFRERLRGYDCRLAKYLADVQVDSPGGGFRRHDINKLERLIAEDYGQTKCLPALRILDNLIVHLNRLYQKSIPRPQLLKSMEEANRLVETDPAALRSVHQWLAADRQWAALVLNAQSGSRNRKGDISPISWEMVVASAALHCGIDNVNGAVALADALCQPGKYFACSPIRVYCDLPVVMNSAGDLVYRRWYPNQQLIKLMTRVRPEAVRASLQTVNTASARERKKAIAAVIVKGISSELIRQGVAPQYLPSSLASFLDAITQGMRTQLPAIFVDFAAGKLPARSLLPPSIGRVTGDPAAPGIWDLPSYAELPDGNAPPERDLPVAYDPEPSERKRVRRDEPDWMRELRYAFSMSKISEVQLALNQLQLKSEPMPAVAKQLISLGCQLMNEFASTGNEWAVSSVKCCVLTVARRFALHRGNANPARYESETLEEIYTAVVANAASESRSPARLQRTVAWALREYQRHIVCFFDANPVNEAVAFRYPTGPLPVDARVISLDDLYDVIDYIKTSPNEQWLPRYRKLAIAETVLAFLGGARRMEGFGLSSRDHLRSLSGLLLIRENDARQLKTSNAQRALFLSVIAHPFTDLADYVSEVFDRNGEDGPSPFEDVSEDVIIPIIHKALQHVTHDDGCHLHSIRHSFGHWMLFRLLLADLNHIPNLFPHLPKTTKWLQASREFRQLLYGNGIVANDHAWATAVQMGHAHPARTSIPTYFHGMDLLLCVVLEQNRVFGVQDAQSSSSTQTGAVAAARLDWCWKDAPVNVQVPGSARQNLRKKPRVEVRQNPQPNPSVHDVFRRVMGLELMYLEVEQPTSRLSEPWIRLTEDLVYMSGALQMECSEISERVGLDVQAVHRIVRNVRSFSKLTWFDNGQPSHAMTPFRGYEERINGPNPIFRLVRPSGERSRLVISKFATQLERFTQKRSNSAREVFTHLAVRLLPGRPSVAFIEPNPVLVRECLAMFQALSWPLADMIAYVSDGTDSKLPSREWLKKWGLSWRLPIANPSGRGRLLRSPEEWLVLEPQFSVGDDASFPESVQMECLHYTLAMAAIRFGSL